MLIKMLAKNSLQFLLFYISVIRSKFLNIYLLNFLIFIVSEYIVKFLNIYCDIYLFKSEKTCQKAPLKSILFPRILLLTFNRSMLIYFLFLFFIILCQINCGFAIKSKHGTNFKFLRNKVFYF